MNTKYPQEHIDAVIEFVSKYSQGTGNLQLPTDAVITHLSMEIPAQCELMNLLYDRPAHSVFNTYDDLKGFFIRNGIDGFPELGTDFDEVSDDHELVKAIMERFYQGNPENKIDGDIKKEQEPEIVQSTDSEKKILNDSNVEPEREKKDGQNSLQNEEVDEELEMIEKMFVYGKKENNSILNDKEPKNEENNLTTDEPEAQDQSQAQTRSQAQAQAQTQSQAQAQAQTQSQAQSQAQGQAQQTQQAQGQAQQTQQAKGQAQQTQQAQGQAQTQPRAQGQAQQAQGQAQAQPRAQGQAQVPPQQLQAQKMQQQRAQGFAVGFTGLISNILAKRTMKKQELITVLAENKSAQLQNNKECIIDCINNIKNKVNNQGMPASQEELKAMKEKAVNLMRDYSHRLEEATEIMQSKNADPNAKRELLSKIQDGKNVADEIKNASNDPDLEEIAGIAEKLSKMISKLLSKIFGRYAENEMEHSPA